MGEKTARGLLSLPCALRSNAWKDVKMGRDQAPGDLMDFILHVKEVFNGFIRGSYRVTVVLTLINLADSFVGASV